MRRTSYFRTIARTPVKAALQLQPRPRLFQRWETIPPAASLPGRPAPSPPEFEPVPSEASSAATHRPDLAPSAHLASVAAPMPLASGPPPPIAPAKREARPNAPELRQGKVAAPSPLVPALQPPVAPVNREALPAAPPPHHPASTPAPEVRRDKDPEGWLATELFTITEQEPAREPHPPHAQAPPPDAAKSPEFAERITATQIAKSPPPTHVLALQAPAPSAPVGPALRAPAEPQPSPHELHIGSIEVQILPPAAPPSPPPVPRRAAQISTGSLSRGYYSTFGIGQG
jgi:hypothetical protein